MKKSALKRYDIFISHANEDKIQVALPLAEYLKKQGLKIWIDELELLLGDSLRESFDKGLSQSRFGVVILSPTFFKKPWANRELNALFAIEDGNEKVILPIWHNLTRDEVLAFSPMLADKFAVSTDQGMEQIVINVMQAIGRETNHMRLNRTSILMRIKKRRELSRIHRKMLIANSASELQKILFRIEEFLLRNPGHPEARDLRESILKAINYYETVRYRIKDRAMRFPSIVFLLRSKRFVFYFILLIIVCMVFIFVGRWRW